MTSVDDQSRAIFLAALEHAPGEWPTFLDAECGNNPNLRARVDELLNAHRAMGSIHVGVADAPGRTIDEPAVGERAGAIIGPYKLLEQIGEGGFGVVFMAEQSEPVRRKVALKILKPGMDTRQVVARFEAERQALAIMDHANIAKVFDGGATESGRPYFVMELVKGAPITDYCDQNHLTPRERLELFVPVCAAVQHAHQKGIIHRDLKPSNVLVSRHDTTPMVKVIDFGVAKALGQGLTDKTLFTALAQLVGTPLYMSPEQAGMSDLDVDTRSDIYSLGVLLYELLTGTTPFTKERFRTAAYDEICRIIREEEPPRPSTRLSDSKDSLPSISAQRQMEPAKLTRLVRGELDWIVMKCLEKDRNRRYETANGLALDIQRHLAGEQVVAHPPSATYRLSKFMRRNKGPMLASSLVLLALIGGIIGTTWGLMQAKRNAQQARDERDAKDAALQAEQQAREDETKARQQAFAALRSMTADVVERKFAQGSVLTDDDRAFLRGVIAQFDAFAAIHGNDIDNRAVRAEGRLRVGAIRYRLGELKQAEQDFDQGLSFYQQLANEFPDRREFRQGVARSHNSRGMLRRDTGRVPQAESDYDQALTLYTELVSSLPSPELREELAKSHLNRGMVFRATGRPKEAEQDFEASLSLYEQLAVELPSRTDLRQELANVFNSRGNLRRETGRPQESEADMDQALTIQKQLAANFPSRPDFRKDLAMSYNNRGNLFRFKGQLKEAEKYYEQALSIRNQLAADFPSQPEFRYDLARSHNNRGDLLREMNRPQEAEQDYAQALSLYKLLVANFSSRPEFRRDQALTINNRAILMISTGRLDEAANDYDQAIGIQMQLAADFPNQPDMRNELARTYLNRAHLHQDQGQWPAAKRLLLEGRPHNLAALKSSPRHPNYRECYRTNLALLIQIQAALLEQDDAVRTAETMRDLGWDAPSDGYDAAAFLSACIPIATEHQKLDEQKRKDAVRFYGDAAMRLLRDAVSKGYKDISEMKKDASLDPVRQRDDFRKLVAELERKEK